MYSYMLHNGSVCSKEHAVSEFKKRKGPGVGWELPDIPECHRMSALQRASEPSHSSQLAEVGKSRRGVPGLLRRKHHMDVW